MNNSRAIEVLNRSIQERTSENERIINETTKQYLESLSKSLSDTLIQSQNSMRQEIADSRQIIRENFREEIRRIQYEQSGYKLTAIIISFFLGAAVSAIMFLIFR